MAKEEIVSGSILAAEPFMVDPNFKRSVILLCEHHNEGSIGFILNKTVNMNINDLLADFPAFESNVYYGGPVKTDTIHYIHNVGDVLDNSQKVADGIYWGGDYEKLKFLIQSKIILPENIRFFVGYSGWSEHQLEEELEHGSWVKADVHANYIFKTDIDQLWNQVMENKGDAFSVIAQIPDAVNWN